MQDALGSVFSNLERFLRWVYPGVLVLGLLHLGTRKGALVFLHLDQNISGSLQIFGLVAAVVVSGLVVYSLQRYLVHEVIIQYTLFFFRLGDAFNYALRHTGAQGHVHQIPPWLQWLPAPAIPWAPAQPELGPALISRVWRWGIGS